MNDRIITLDELRRLTGYQRAGRIEQWLRERGIGFVSTPLGPVTTIDALNAALGAARRASTMYDADAA